VLLVTDAGLAATSVVARVVEVLSATGCDVHVYDGILPNAPIHCIDAGADLAAALDAGALVAVGGGSSLDASKGIAVGATNPRRGRGLDYLGEFEHDALPIVAVPTTAGTGSETNAFGVATDPESGRRFYVGHASALPVGAVLDPDLTVGLPPRPTAATGMDALVHGVESYLSRRANPWADGIALQVVATVSRFLPSAVEDGADVEARAQLLLAAHSAGIGMATTGLGLVHGIGHAIGGRHGIAHGTALCTVLPEVLTFCAPVRQDRLSDVAHALGVARTDASTARNAEAAIEAIDALAQRVGQRPTLSQLGIGPASLDQIAVDTVDDVVSVNSPREATVSDVRTILEQVAG
jgi:alcohol dehydrogenase